MARLSPSLWGLVSKSGQKQDNTSTISHKDAEESSMVEDENEHNAGQENGVPEWCICGQCREMKKEVERVCCKNMEKNHEHELFENHVLTEHNLELAMRTNADFFNYPFDPTRNASWRFNAYRQFIIWVWGKLGRRNRKVVPSCVIWKIRDRFPDASGNYTGFMDVDFSI